MNNYTTKSTYLGNGIYGCRVFYNGKLIVEGRGKKSEIGAVFRDLLRTLDKCGGDSFTSAARKRKYKEGNLSLGVKHYWGGKS
mgnify:CR=1 FL=1